MTHLYLTLFLFLALSVRAGPEWQPQNVTAKGVVVPLYVPGENAAAVVLRVGRVYSDYERHGFFRIGLFPLLVAEDVRIELASDAKATNYLAHTRGWLEKFSGGRVLELRQVSLRVQGEEAPRLFAGRARLQGKGQWQLAGGITLRAGSNSLESPEATLRVGGPQAGLLTWKTTNSVRQLNLFCSSTYPTITQPIRSQ